MVVARERNCFLCFVKILERLLSYATLTRPADFSSCLFRLLVGRWKVWKFMQHLLWTFFAPGHLLPQKVTLIFFPLPLV